MVDTSGSMTTELMRKCLAEVYTLVYQKKPEKLVVVQNDTKVQDLRIFNNLQEFKKSLSSMKVHGGGGTSFNSFWELLKNKGKGYGRDFQLTFSLPTDCAIIFTDGYVDQIPRDKRTMKYLVWVILDNPSWELKNKDMKTKVIYLNTKEL